jgi:hypothetical protein
METAMVFLYGMYEFPFAVGILDNRLVTTDEVVFIHSLSFRSQLGTEGPFSGFLWSHIQDTR